MRSQSNYSASVMEKEKKRAMTIRHESFERAIRASWTSETTSIPIEWNALTAPERGQCVPTSLVVQDYLGGEIERVATSYQGYREAHYRNVVGGELVDFTRGQYPYGNTFIPAPVIGRTDYSNLRDFMLSYPATQIRYHLLATRVARLLALESVSL